MNRRVLGIPLWGFGVIAVGAFVGLAVARNVNGGAYWRTTPVDDSAENVPMNDSATATALAHIVTASSGGTIPPYEASIGAQPPNAGRIG